MQVNTPISTWFDGVNVDKYISSPDIIELANVQGTFNENDVIGYYDIDLNVFQPIATVISSYKYPDSSNTRLYITGNYNSTYPNISYYRGNVLSNSQYDANGNYVANTAFGSLTTSNIINIHKSGFLSAVGGKFTEVSGTSIKYYFVGGAYGIWGSPTGGGSQGLPYGKFYFNAPSAGTYILNVNGDDNQSGYIKVDGTSYWTNSAYGYGDVASFYLSAGTHTFEIYAVDYQGDGDQWLGAYIRKIGRAHV